MPNIYIKTRMRKMPECCAKCPRYMASIHYDQNIFCDIEEHYPPRCWNNDSMRSLEKIQPTKERPAWCPLVEREEKQNG